jgi:hypothetical protein
MSTICSINFQNFTLRTRSVFKGEGVIRNAGMLAYRIGVSLIYVILLLLVAGSILNSSSRVYLNFKCLSPVD